jgi:hypothetical protein
MKRFSLFFLISILSFCTPKGPQTFNNPLVGKTKQELIDSRGKAKEVRVSGSNYIYIYKVKEEYYGKKEKLDNNQKPIVKKKYIIEYIYYINKEGIIYKYQVWRKKVKNT